MITKVLIINGNPAVAHTSFSTALCDAYQDGSLDAGYVVRRQNLAELSFDPILHEGLQGNQPLEPDLVKAQDDVLWAEHLVFVYPMWQLGLPALLKGFCERALCPGFAYPLSGKKPLELGLLKGRSARIIQTMSMSEAVYRARYHAHCAKAFRDSLNFFGMDPIRISYCGQIEGSAETRRKYLMLSHRLGYEGI